MFFKKLILHFDKSVYLLTVAVLVLGALAYMGLPRETFPEIEVPYFLVNARYEGASPEDVESLITIPIENEVSGVTGIENFTSTSSEGSMRMFVEFDTDVDLDRALDDLQDAVDEAIPDLPDDLDSDPTVRELNFARDFPVVVLAVAGDLKDFQLQQITDRLQDAIEAVPDVLEAEVVGVREQEFHIIVDPLRLASYKIQLQNVQQAIRDRNGSRSAQFLEIDDGRYNINVPSAYETPQDFLNTVIAVYDQQPVYLRDIAEVRLGFEEEQNLTRVNQKKTALLRVKIKSGGDIIALSDNIHLIVDEAKKRYPQVNLVFVKDSSDNIRSLVSDLEGTVLIGFIVLLVTIFFALGLINSLFVAMAIPLSATLSLVVLDALGYTLNQMVLSGMLVSLGMLVDNAIVIVEGIYQRIQRGVQKLEAAVETLKDIGWPVVASTATTIAAFLPLAFWPGLFGGFFRPFVVTLICTISSSLLVAIFINPLLCAQFMPVRIKQQSTHLFFANIYQKFLSFCLKAPWLIILAVLAYFFTSFFVFGKLGSGVRFFPTSTPSAIITEIEVPDGLTLHKVNELLSPIEDFINENYREQFDTMNTVVSLDSGELTTNLKDAAELSIDYNDIIDKQRENFAGLPGYKLKVDKQVDGPPQRGEPVNLEISSNDPQELEHLVRKSEELLAEIRGVVDIDDDLSLSVSKISVDVDPLRAPLQNVSHQNIALSISAATTGYVLDTYSIAGEDYDVKLIYPDDEIRDLNSLAALNILTDRGETVPLASVASVQIKPTSGVITHKDKVRVATVTAQNRGRNVNEIVAEFRSRQQDYDIPLESVKFTGEQQDLQETQSFMIKAMLIAISLIWIVLLAQFNSIPNALLVLLGAILPIAGVFWGLSLLGAAFYMTFSGIAVVSLAGVAVNNSIVLISHITSLRKKGLALKEAVLEGSFDRFRPIILTSITTIVGILPMAIGLSFNPRTFAFSLASATSETWKPMGQAVAGGMIFATLLTLIAIPTVYYVAQKRGEKKRLKRLAQS